MTRTRMRVEMCVREDCVCVCWRIPGQRHEEAQTANGRCDKETRVVRTRGSPINNGTWAYTAFVVRNTDLC